MVSVVAVTMQTVMQVGIDKMKLKIISQKNNQFNKKLFIRGKRQAAVWNKNDNLIYIWKEWWDICGEEEKERILTHELLHDLMYELLYDEKFIDLITEKFQKLNKIKNELKK